MTFWPWPVILQWHPNRSNFPWPCYRAGPSTNYEWFLWSVCNGCGMQEGNDLTIPDTWFRPTFWDLFMLQLLRPVSPSVPCFFLTFHFEYPSVLSRFCSFKQVDIVFNFHEAVCELMCWEEYRLINKCSVRLRFIYICKDLQYPRWIEGLLLLFSTTHKIKHSTDMLFPLKPKLVIFDKAVKVSFYVSHAVFCAIMFWYFKPHMKPTMKCFVCHLFSFITGHIVIPHDWSFPDG